MTELASSFSIRITTIREPGAAWAGRTPESDSCDDAVPHAASANATASRTAQLASGLGSRVEAVERLEDQIGRVTEIEGNGRLPLLHGLEHRGAEVNPHGAKLRGGRSRAPGPAAPRLDARQLPPQRGDVIGWDCDAWAHPCAHPAT